MRQRNSIFSVLSATALLLALSATSATAVDGVIEINQARALAGNVTPGDEPGFPVTISRAGSYRLTGNLTIDVTNKDVISVISKDVTIDLNGFAIIGPTVCSGAPLVCSPAGASTGILSYSNSISVSNGTVRGMGVGIGLYNASNAHVEKIRAISNSSTGIAAGRDSSIINSMASYNGNYGIWALFGCTVIGNITSYNVYDGIRTVSGTVTNNSSSHNGGSGITLTNGVAMGNVLSDNVYKGIYLSSASGCTNNIFFNNNGGNASSQYDCTPLGSNICGSGVCP